MVINKFGNAMSTRKGEMSLADKKKTAFDLKMGLEAIIDGVKVRARKLADPNQMPCNECKVKCDLYENMPLICSLLDDYKAQYYYLEYVLPPKEGKNLK